MPHILLTATVAREQADTCQALLTLAGMSGCEEQLRGSHITFRAYFAPSLDPTALCAQLARGCPDAATCVETVADQDWNARWRESVQPVEVAERVWVSPSWRPPELPAGGRWIRIEPATAFGTGHHETTRLAASLLARHTAARTTPWTLLDIGAGSGILCFCGRLFGAARCVGVEIDVPALENMSDNRRDNPTLNAIDFVIGTTAALHPSASFDVVVMNMLLRRSQPLLGDARRCLGPHGTLLWTGLLGEERDEACTAAAAQGFSLHDEATQGEWWGGTFRPPHTGS